MTHTKTSLSKTGHDALCNLAEPCGCRVGGLYPCGAKDASCTPARWHACERCGREGAYLSGDATICGDCREE